MTVGLPLARSRAPTTAAPAPSPNAPPLRNPQQLPKRVRPFPPAPTPAPSRGARRGGASSAAGGKPRALGLGRRGEVILQPIDGLEALGGEGRGGIEGALEARYLRAALFGQAAGGGQVGLQPADPPSNYLRMSST